MAELAEGARLLSECAVKAAPRVRIPLSPPFKYESLQVEIAGLCEDFIFSELVLS